MFFKWLVLGKGWVDDIGREAMAHWNVERRVIAVEQLSRNSDSMVTVQRLFRRKFNVERRGAIPDRNTTLRWVEAFRTTRSFHSSRNRSCAAKNVGRMRFRTLRRGSECVSGRKDVIWLTLF